MCVSSPKVQTPDMPVIPERQPTKLPDNGSTAASTALDQKRRRGMYAAILTNQSTLGQPITTGRTTTG
jgi:hypothetical protein